MVEYSQSTPDVRSLQTVTGAAALWAYAVALCLVAIAACLGAVQNFVDAGTNPPTVTNASFAIGTGVLGIVAGALVVVLAAFVVRTGFSLQAGNPAPHLRMWALTGAALVATIGVLWIYGASVTRSSVLADLRAPGIMLIVCAVLIAGAAYLWHGTGQTRVVAGLMGIVAALTVFVTGRMTEGAPRLLDAVLPLGVLPAFGFLVLAIGAAIWLGAPRARPLAWLALSVAFILLAIAAIVSMSDTLASNPFSPSGSKDWANAGTVVQGIAAIFTGLAGIGLLLCALLSLVVHGPALTSLATSSLAVRNCPKCGTGMSASARFCNGCGVRVASS